MVESSATAVTVGKENNSVTVVEMATVRILCPGEPNQLAWWKVRTILHSGESHAIYWNGSLASTFINTGRYSCAYTKGVYQLTIINITVTEAGEYQCFGNEAYDEPISAFLKVEG
jgi:hypothetical protein